MAVIEANAVHVTVHECKHNRTCRAQRPDLGMQEGACCGYEQHLHTAQAGHSAAQPMSTKELCSACPQKLLCALPALKCKTT